MNRALSFVLFFIALTGCSTIVIHSGSAEKEAQRAAKNPVTVKREHHFFLFGSYSPQKVTSLSVLCPKGWSTIRSETTGPEALAKTFSLQLYSPWMSTVTCLE